jgi:hypothetical protein
MEPHVCDLVNIGTIAMDQFDKNEGLFIFAVGKLEDMLNEFRARYYAEEFPIWNGGADRSESATGNGWPLTNSRRLKR